MMLNAGIPILYYQKKQKLRNMRKINLLGFIMLVLLGMISNNLVAQGVPITGTVLSDDGSPLAGATVLVTGTTRATTTDNAGKFSINADEGTLLEFSYVGLSTQRIKASKNMEVRLSEGESVSMNDVVVTAFGVKKERKALGYSVTELNAAELMKNKNTNVVNSLAGKVPGVNITQFSG